MGTNKHNKSVAMVHRKLAKLLNEYEQFNNILTNTVDNYKTACSLTKAEASVKRTKLLNRFRTIRDAADPAEISNEDIKVVKENFNVTSKIDSNMLFLYGRSEIASR